MIIVPMIHRVTDTRPRCNACGQVLSAPRTLLDRVLLLLTTLTVICAGYWGTFNFSKFIWPYQAPDEAVDYIMGGLLGALIGGFICLVAMLSWMVLTFVFGPSDD